MSETYTRYTMQAGSSEVLQVPDDDRYYVVGSTWEGSRIVGTSIEGVHADQDDAGLHVARLNEPSAFWSIEREKGESMRDFVIRTWSTCYPTMTQDELQAIAPEQQSAEIVKDGYLSPYLFGRVLRWMVDDKNAAILGAYMRDGESAIYYTWGRPGDNGPTLAAFYDPAKRTQTAHTSDIAPGWFDAAGELTAS